MSAGLCVNGEFRMVCRKSKAEALRPKVLQQPQLIIRKKQLFDVIHNEATEMASFKSL